MSKQRIIELRARISEAVFLHERLGKYIQRLVAATRPYNPDTDWQQHSPSTLVERGVDLGASPRAIICWSRLAKVWALLQHQRAEVYPEDVQELAPFVLGHRIWLGPHAASHGLTTDAVIRDVIERWRSRDAVAQRPWSRARIRASCSRSPRRRWPRSRAQRLTRSIRSAAGGGRAPAPWRSASRLRDA